MGRAKRSRKVPDGPPQKRSPASPASENGAHSNNAKSQRETSTKAEQDSQATKRRLFWVTHGQTNAGFVEQIGESYKALAADERALGTFANLTAAADAVSAAYEAAR